MRLDGRKSPGLLMPGDSLKQVQDAVDELMELRGHDDALQEVAEAIKALSDSYESMMREANLRLPY
ncbi:DUF6959 family protein [Amycolatopsis nalaikhensis]|uniref:Uncharacterized protein n=1 Tax=Amycolatopsis nalaikhensis TaxID=715472 RepID=A0ABY8XNI4_9PSEU|nr:hypothetical protein [Amycolatopsis sp. 2-2]WIV57225.1 hypothetical protein QP939_00545 [Amycolatopsis sp. 2-2]